MVVTIKRSITFLIGLSLSTLLTFALSASSPSPTREKLELPQETVFKKVLDNGLTILIKENPSFDLVAIDIKVKSGSSLEGEYSGSGISHFVEHMVFKGTKSRKVGDIEREIKSYGGFINGTSSHDLTSLHVTVPSKYFANALSLLKDMLLNATFEEGEFEKEKEVIFKEINLNKDEPKYQLMRLLYETSYIYHPYKYPVIGYEEQFKSLTREDLIKYYNRSYAPNRIVIAVVGGVDKRDAISTIENGFKDFRAANYKIEGQILEPPQICERRLQNESSITLSYLAMGFHSTSILDKDLFAMDVLSMVLGRGDDSRLNVSLFKEKRIVHSISSWNYTPKDPGLFVVTSILDKDNLDSTEKNVLNEIQKLKDGFVEDGEIESAKRMVLSDYIFSRETIEEQASDISSGEILTGNYNFSHRYVDGVQAVTKEDLKRVANAYLATDNLTVVRLVPTASVTSEEKFDTPPTKKDFISKVVLPNGLKVLLREDKKIPAVSISLVMLGGISVEDEVNNGISNLSAKMLLVGTTTRKESQIKGAIENLGGSVTPFSGFDSFGLNITVLKSDLDFALKILKDVLTNSVFPQGELDREKSVILAMIKEEDDDIFTKGSHLLRKNLFGNHPYGLRNIGEEESIKSLKRDDLLNFYKIYCVPNNMVISISGDIESEILMAKLGDYFLDIVRKEVPPIPTKEVTHDMVKSQTFEMDRREALVLMGFKTISLKDTDRYAFDLLGSILSGYSGRLKSELRDKLSLAYTLGCVQKWGIDTGFLVFYAATTKDKILDTKRALIDAIKDIKSKAVGDEELALAKRESLSFHKMKMQANGFISFQSALDELFGLGHDNLYKYEGELEKVAKDDIKRVANKYLDLDIYSEVIISSK